jgi:ABC-type Zn uptake system ZnuABC Zn-binding protein ZnuA
MVPPLNIISPFSREEKAELDEPGSVASMESISSELDDEPNSSENQPSQADLAALVDFLKEKKRLREKLRKAMIQESPTSVPAERIRAAHRLNGISRYEVVSSNQLDLSQKGSNFYVRI